LQKTIHHQQFGHVQIMRRKGTRHIKITIGNDGLVRLSLPYQVSESAGLKFLESKQEWVAKHRKVPAKLDSGDRIGKAHYLRFVATSSSQASGRVVDNEVRISVPPGLSYDSEPVKKAIAKASLRALQAQADSLLPKRLASLAEAAGLSYQSVSCRPLKSRWGSCTSKNEITFNVFLMQIEWPLIDYVIFHELCHTVHHDHSRKFWDLVSTVSPNYKELRRQLKLRSPSLMAV
jgi:predicted metal-dependent hydrolase